MTRKELKEKIDVLHQDFEGNRMYKDHMDELLSLIDSYTKPKGKSIEERKINFGLELTNFYDQYHESMLKDFCEYWTEHSPKAKKMRFEKEKAFDISRRLKTWARNQQRFNGTNNNTSDQAINDFLNG